MSAAARRRHAPPPTPEQLRMAIRQMRRPHWPASDEDVLAHPTYGPCVRCLARDLGRAPFNGKPSTPKPSGRALPRLTFDARRAAANDRDD